MSQTPPPLFSRATIQMAAAGVIGAAVAATLNSGFAGLGDTDPYRHLAYARELWRSRFALSGHPFLPFTLLGDSGVDLWRGFHLLMIPFSFFGTLWGGRVAGVCIAGAVAASIAGLLHRAGQPRAWPFTVAPLAVSHVYLLRDGMARPSHLTIPLLLVYLAAGCGELSWIWAAAGALVHVWLHLSAAVAPVFVVIGWLGSRSAKQRGAPRAVLGCVGGLVVGTLLRPDRWKFVSVSFAHNFGALGISSVGLLPHASAELQATQLGTWVSETWLGLTLVGAATLLRRFSPEPTGPSSALRRASYLAAAVALVMSLRSNRFMDYSAPLMAFAAGATWPLRVPVAVSKRMRLLPVLLAVLFAWRVEQGISSAWATTYRNIPPPGTVEAFAAAVRSHVPPGSLLFTDDLFLTSVLYDALPDYRYVGAYEPALLYGRSPDRFWSWHHAVREGIDCSAPSCPPQRPSEEGIAAALARFGSEWAVTSYPPGVFSMQSILLEGGHVFELVSFSPGPTFGFFLWHLRSKHEPSDELRVPE